MKVSKPLVLCGSAASILALLIAVNSVAEAAPVPPPAMLKELYARQYYQQDYNSKGERIRGDGEKYYHDDSKYHDNYDEDYDDGGDDNGDDHHKDKHKSKDKCEEDDYDDDYDDGDYDYDDGKDGSKKRDYDHDTGYDWTKDYKKYVKEKDGGGSSKKKHKKNSNCDKNHKEGKDGEEHKKNKTKNEGGDDGPVGGKNCPRPELNGFKFPPIPC